MATSANGWDVLNYGDDRLHKWVIPGTGRHLVERHGCGGFLIAHYALWYHEEVERLNLSGEPWDEWGHAVRPVKGKSTGYSNHASGTAADLNATLHPLGADPYRSFTDKQIAHIARVLEKQYKGCLRSGIFYNGRKDGMHIEVDVPLKTANPHAVRLMRSERGKRVLAANPGQKKVILS